MASEALRLSGSGIRLRFLDLWERIWRLGRRSPKRLRLCESLPLGERRFVAVVEFEAERFLIGGTPTSMVLLSRLGDRCCDQRQETESGLNPAAIAAAGNGLGQR